MCVMGEILSSRIIHWVIFKGFQECKKCYFVHFFFLSLVCSFIRIVSIISVAQSCLTLCDPMDYSTPGFLSFTISPSLLKLMSIELVMLSNHLILCCPLLLPSIFPSIRVFSNESVLHIRWLKYWSFSISLFNEYSGLISFTMDRLDLLAGQGSLKSLLQDHS